MRVPEEPLRPEDDCELGSDALEAEQHRRWRRCDGVVRGKQRILLALHCLDLHKKQFLSVEPVEAGLRFPATVAEISNPNFYT